MRPLPPDPPSDVHGPRKDAETRRDEGSVAQGMQPAPDGTGEARLHLTDLEATCYDDYGAVIQLSLFSPFGVRRTELEAR